MLTFQLMTFQLKVGILSICSCHLPASIVIDNCSSYTGGLDYKPISDQQLTFSADLLEADITVGIIDDFLFEHNESLLVKMELISEPFPGLIVVDNVSITIIDNNDGMFVIIEGGVF